MKIGSSEKRGRRVQKKSELHSRLERRKIERERERERRVSAEGTIVQPVNAPCNLPDIRAIRVQMDDRMRYALVFLPGARLFSIDPFRLDKPVKIRISYKRRGPKDLQLLRRKSVQLKILRDTCV